MAASLFSLPLLGRAAGSMAGLKATSVTSAEGGLTWRDKGRGEEEDLDWHLFLALEDDMV